MGGCRCSYKNCQNTTKTTENVHFFHYPVKHKERCKIWIENAGKPHFCDLEEDQLRNKVICEFHFEDKCFSNSQKKRLLQGAIPTLDVGCKEEPPSEPDMYVSSGLHDFQLLPASKDGSVFILDTDLGYQSQKVESYIYKNGMIVPSGDDKIVSPVTRPSTSKVINLNMAKPKNLDMNVQQMNFITLKKEAPEYGMKPVQALTDENESANFVKKPPLNSVQNPGINKSKGKLLSRTYLRKIKQHSIDIACIKKMLQEKLVVNDKPDSETILNALKPNIVPTLFAVLSINYTNNYELTEEDEEFFTTIHSMSPEVYELLVKKYKWNLPTIDTSLE